MDDLSLHTEIHLTDVFSVNLYVFNLNKGTQYLMCYARGGKLIIHGTMALSSSAVQYQMEACPSTAWDLKPFQYGSLFHRSCHFLGDAHCKSFRYLPLISTQ